MGRTCSPTSTIKAWSANATRKAIQHNGSGEDERCLLIIYTKLGQSRAWSPRASHKSWEPILRPTGPHILVSDAERSIRSNLAENPDNIQLDLVHAVKEALFKLWGEGMPKQQRDEVSREMRRILFTLVNSVKKQK